MSQEELEKLEQRYFHAQGEENNVPPEEAQLAEVFSWFKEKKTRIAQKKQMEAFHSRMEAGGKAQLAVRYRAKNFVRNHLSTSLVAASISLLVVFGSLLFFNHINSLERKQQSYYTSMRREIAKLKAQTSKIQTTHTKLLAQSSSEEEKAPSIYGATAFLIDERGYMLTGYHVIKDSKVIIAEKDTNSYEMEVVKSYPDYDLAILRVKGEAIFFSQKLSYSLDTTSSLRLGESIYTLAYPKEDVVYGEGYIAALSGYESDTTAYQISIPVNPGSSGAPVINKQGKLVGIITAKNTQADGAAYALKSRFIYNSLQELCVDSLETPLVQIPKKNKLEKLDRLEQIQLLRGNVYQLKVSGI